MKNFTINELCRSDTALRKKIDNTPPLDVVANLERLVLELLDPVREVFGKPIYVKSGYRSLEVNALVGGVLASQHCKGEAVDLVADDNKTLFLLIKNNFLFDQLIDEKNYQWIHVSYTKGKNRKQTLHLS